MTRTTSFALLVLAGLGLGACGGGGLNATNDGRMTTVGAVGGGNADGSLVGGRAALGRGGFAGGAAAGAAAGGPLSTPYGLNSGRPAWR
jgi:osmotically inducible lipoprotein OsmB